MPSSEKRKEIYRKSNKKYYSRNKDKLVTTRKNRRQEWRMELLALFGNKCNRCGFSDRRALQIDHINGGGTKENRSMHGTQRSRYFLIQAEEDIETFLSKYQLLCANCNWIKRYENNEVRNFKH